MHLPLLQLVRHLSVLLGVAFLLGVASPASAGEPDCRKSLREIVEIQDFRLAYVCATNLLDREPQNTDALLVLARAAQELGQMEYADSLAKEARTHELTTGQRFAAYLISGMAQASQQNLTSAKILLYRASDFAHLEPEHAIVRSVLTQIASQSPWRVSVVGNILPSSNINSGSMHDTIELGGFEFILDEDAKAQSGIGYSVSAEATHRRRVSSRTIWENTLTASGTAYDGRGRNDAQLQVTTGLRFTPAANVPSLVYGFVAFNRQFIADEISGAAFAPYSPYYTQTIVGAEYHRNAGTNAAWNVYATFANRKSDISATQDALVAKVGGAYTIALRENLTFGVDAYAEQTASEAADTAAKAYNLSFEATYAPDNLPLTLSGVLGYTHTAYEHLMAGYSDMRVDDDVSVELAVTHDNIQFYGFNPTFGVKLTRDFSNLARYDMESMQAFTRLSTSF